MNQFLNATENNHPVKKKKFIEAVIVVMTISLFSMSCTKQHKESPEETEARVINDIESVLPANNSFSAQTIQELRDARAASAKYRNIENAIQDGYADISVVVQNMGYHYMKASLADTVFDPKKPEILVYNKSDNGKQELVAVEYAVPISLMPSTAPTGFTGSADVWKYDTGFGLWLLHAWVWQYNPAGIFNPTNPGVHVH